MMSKGTVEPKSLQGSLRWGAANHQNLPASMEDEHCQAYKEQANGQHRVTQLIVNESDTSWRTGVRPVTVTALLEGIVSKRPSSIVHVLAYVFVHKSQFSFAGSEASNDLTNATNAL